MGFPYKITFGPHFKMNSERIYNCSISDHDFELTLDEILLFLLLTPYSDINPIITYLTPLF